MHNLRLSVLPKDTFKMWTGAEIEPQTLQLIDDPPPS